jgi:hypothetical protein
MAGFLPAGLNARLSEAKLAVLEQVQRLVRRQIAPRAAEFEAGVLSRKRPARFDLRSFPDRSGILMVGTRNAPVSMVSRPGGS